MIDPALVAAIGTNQAPASAQAAQGLSVEELAPAQISLVRTALAAGVKPAWIAREFGIPAAAVRRLQPPRALRPEWQPLWSAANLGIEPRATHEAIKVL